MLDISTLYSEIFDASTFGGYPCGVDENKLGEPERLGAWLNLIQANRVVSDALELALEAAAGLSLAEHELLIRIAHSPDGRLRMADLASLLLVSKSGVTRLVDRVEQAGLVRRELSPEDRRVTFARITGAGRQALARANPAFAVGLERSFSTHLDDADVQCLRAALRKVLAGNGEWEEDRCSPDYASEEPAETASRT
jgi:DNA-binding MarR family transcriptional regulator